MIIDHYFATIYYLQTVFYDNAWYLPFIRAFPIVFILELPFYLIILIFSVRGWLRIHFQPEADHYCPLVSVIVTAYNETLYELDISVRSIMEQIYSGPIEIFIVIDNASENRATVLAMKNLKRHYSGFKNRSLRIIEKSTRGGHASSNNLGLRLARGVMMILIDADTSIDNLSVSKAVRHFKDENVIAVSGGVRVRNIKDSILTRFQAIEYMLGIQLGRFGLTEVSALNTMSGAFSIFRRTFLKQIGGWLNGSGEDLDITLRIHAYTSRYPKLKIVNEPEAIAWTAAPKTLRRLLKQRARWDGDTYYIYIRRHWKKFNVNAMGSWKTIVISWYALLFLIILPFVMILYYVYMLIAYSVPSVIAISILIYFYYLIISFFMYFLFLLLISERPKHDLKLVGWMFLMPIYQQAMRLISGLFILNEMFFKSHRESTMAPWWVIKKTK